MAASEEIIELARGAATGAAEVKPTSVVAIDVSERLILTEVFLVISGESQPQLRAIVNAVDRAMHEAGEKVRRREGFDAEMHWVLLDYGDLIVHVQLEEDREFYALEKLWADCPQIDLGVDLRTDAVGDEPSTLDRLLGGSGEAVDSAGGSAQ
ncbi:MAG: ribosome silencing factor [Ancrocorticia sp.]|uniref:ribosome silencing factor n=1 Tax=Ancrocorticia sp. TaxID=2593684 RepID=UPI003F92E60D